MKRIGLALDPLVRELGLEGGIRLESLKHRWVEVVGSPLCLHSAPISLSDGRLVVALDSSPWLQQARFFERSLMEKLSPLGISAVSFRIGRVRPESPAPNNDAPEKTPPSPHALDMIDKLVSQVSDETLKKSIHAAMYQWAMRSDVWRGRPLS